MRAYLTLLIEFKGLTISSDGTSHRHNNFEGRHIAVAAPSYEPGADPTERKHKNRLVGVHSSISHSSDQQFCDWEKHLGDIISTFNNSPFARRNGLRLSFEEFVQKLKGMNGDHAADVIKHAGKWEALKKCITIGALGRKVLSMKSSEELLAFLYDENQKKIEALGGQAVWEAMSTEQQDAIDEVFVREMLQHLGEAAHASLPEDVRRAMDFFVRAGCCMHKDLNSVKGGCKAMAMWYATSGATPPVLLANKDNDITISNMSNPSEPGTAAENHALEVTGRGGPKATAIAGAIFNHQNDKKGQQDTHRNYFEEAYGYKFNFPDTSNTRYGSHCEAAAEILVHLGRYREFLIFIKDSKTHRRFNHMELNLKKALDDPPTLTELAVMALYAQSVTHPYMHQVRGPGTENVNVLDLGPLHHQVVQHVRKIASDPGLLISDDEGSYRQAALDGKPWHQQHVIMTVLAMKDSLPHLKELIAAFFHGSLVTWERFISEFAPGGLIDMSTIEERDLAWMPSTNDANEGALGSFRVYLRAKPSTSMHHYNAQAVFRRNETQLFMNAKLDEEDHKYIRTEARRIQASGEEKAQAKALIMSKKAQVTKRQDDDAKRIQKRTEKEIHLKGIAMILNKDRIRKLSNAELLDQIQLHRPHNPNIPLKSALKRKIPMLEALDAAIDYYNSLPEGSTLEPISSTIAHNVDMVVEDRWDLDDSDMD